MNVTIEVPQDLPAVVVSLRRATDNAGAAEYDSWASEANGELEYASWSRVFGNDTGTGA
jgi:hypothetical protein